MYSMYLLTAVLLASVFQCSLGLSCACNPRQCPLVENCPYGTGLDPCFCCTVCNLGPGDTCGGPFDIAGRCGEGLTCVRSRKGDVNLEGVCQPESGENFPEQPEQHIAPHLPLGAPHQPLTSNSYQPIRFPTAAV